jgi:hypothetical protein
MVIAYHDPTYHFDQRCAIYGPAGTHIELCKIGKSTVSNWPDPAGTNVGRPYNGGIDHKNALQIVAAVWPVHFLVTYPVLKYLVTLWTLLLLAELHSFFLSPDRLIVPLRRLGEDR